MRWIALLILGGTLGGAALAHAQNGASGANVTVQLPNFSTFGVNTSVLVPDSGPSPYAAQRQARYSRAMYGRFGSRAFDSQRSAAISSATAQVHDARAADAALLQAARARRTNWVRGSVTGRAATASVDAPDRLQSVAKIQADRQRQQDAANREAESLLEKARAALLGGKDGVAQIYYGMASRQASGPLQTRIEDEAALHKRSATAATLRRPERQLIALPKD